MNLTELAARFKDAKKVGKVYKTKCPAHDDSKASLSIFENRSGNPTLKCFAGCDRDTVLAAVGLTWKDLSNGRTRYDDWTIDVGKTAPLAEHPQLGKPAGRWTYKNRAGKPLCYVYRFETAKGKEFRPLTFWRNGNKGEWRWTAPSEPRPLYHSDLLADNPDSVAIVCEGEKAADAAGKLFPDAISTTTLGGASAPQKTDFQPLSGRIVWIWPDNDASGKGYADSVMEICKKAGAKEVKRLKVSGDKSTGWDAADALAEGWKPEIGETFTLEGRSIPTGYMSLKDIWTTVFPDVKYQVPGLLTSGVYIFSGKPKAKKSFLMLNLAIAIGTGGMALGKIPVEKGRVLYLALEDPERRIHRRIKDMERTMPEGDIGFYTSWRRLDKGGLEDLEAWMEAYPDTRLIVIDTFTKVRPRGGRGNAYSDDYDAGEMLTSITKKHEVSIVLIYHSRKEDAEDPIDLINATLGLAGGVDGYLVLRKQVGTNTAFLYVNARDLEEEKDYALKWNQDLVLWEVQEGDASIHKLTPERRAIHDALAEYGPLSTKEVAERTHPGIEITDTKESKEYRKTQFLLYKLRDGGYITLRHYDRKWEVFNTTPTNTTNTASTTNTTNTTNTGGNTRGGASGASAVLVGASGNAYTEDPRHTRATAESASGASGVSGGKQEHSVRGITEFVAEAIKGIDIPPGRVVDALDEADLEDFRLGELTPGVVRLIAETLARKEKVIALLDGIDAHQARMGENAPALPDDLWPLLTSGIGLIAVGDKSSRLEGLAYLRRVINFYPYEDIKAQFKELESMLNQGE